MGNQVDLLKDYTENVFSRIDRTLNGVEEKHMMWKPTEASNNGDWLLNHMCRIANVSLPRILTGNQEYTPAGWSETYREDSHSLEDYKKDLSAAKTAIISALDSVTDSMLEEEIPLWRGRMFKRKAALFNYFGELVHHNGQIAYLKGTMTRLAEKDPDLLK